MVTGEGIGWRPLVLRQKRSHRQLVPWPAILAHLTLRVLEPLCSEGYGIWLVPPLPIHLYTACGRASRPTLSAWVASQCSQLNSNVFRNITQQCHVQRFKCLSLVKGAGNPGARGQVIQGHVAWYELTTCAHSSNSCDKMCSFCPWIRLQ